MKASLALFSLLTLFTSYSLKSPAVPPTVVQIQANTNLAIADGARLQIGSTLFYDPAYVQLTYPGGDVPQERGVCSDVVIRALRSQKVDLQKLVHEDMAKNFAAYPQKWQLKRPTATSITVGCLIWKPGLPATIKHAPPARTPVTIKRAILSPGD